MSGNPFDVLHAPDIGKGAQSPEEIFVEVGRALDSWELMEEQLAEIFHLLAGRPSAGETSATSPAVRAYGTVVTFRGRRELITGASEAFFVGKQTGIHAELKSFLNRCDKFSARRNDIAHGVVKKIQIDAARPGLPEGIKDDTWYLVPASYNSTKTTLLPRDVKITQKRKMDADETVRAYLRKLVRDGLGRYKYNHLQVRHYGEQFRILLEDAKKMLGRLDSA